MPTDPMRRMIEETTAASSVTSELLYEALDAVPTAVYIKNRNHRLLFVNDACCELLGRSRPELFSVAEAEILSADRKSTRLNSSHVRTTRMPSSA